MTGVEAIRQLRRSGFLYASIIKIVWWKNWSVSKIADLCALPGHVWMYLPIAHTARTSPSLMVRCSLHCRGCEVIKRIRIKKDHPPGRYITSRGLCAHSRGLSPGPKKGREFRIQSAVEANTPPSWCWSAMPWPGAKTNQRFTPVRGRC